MNKLRQRLAKLLVDQAKKLDKKVIDDMIPKPIQPPPMPYIDYNAFNVTYDQYNVDRVRSQFMISGIQRDMMKNNPVYKQEVPNMMMASVAQEILKKYKDEIKEIDLDDKTIYSLDIYVCKPNKSERIK